MPNHAQPLPRQQPTADGSSVRSDSSALSVLAKMMREQAALVQAMAEHTHPPVTADSLSLPSMPSQAHSKLTVEKEELNHQVIQLQRHLQNVRAKSGFSSLSGSVQGSLQGSLRGSIQGSVHGSVQEEEEFDDIDDDKSYASGRSGRSGGSKVSKKSLRSLASSKASTTVSKRASKRGGFEADLPEFVRPPSPALWRLLAAGCTACIPDACVPRTGVGAKRAWREKVTVCILAVLLSLIIVGGIGFLPIYFCKASNFYTAQEVTHPDWVTVFGKIYDLTTFEHPTVAVQDIGNLRGDISHDYFARTAPAGLPELCLDTADKREYIQTNLAESVCENNNSSFSYCHTSITGVQRVRRLLQPYYTHNDIVVPESDVAADESLQWIRIDTSIYNVTSYVQPLRDVTGKIDERHDHPAAYLHSTLHNLIVKKFNEDATGVFNDLFDATQSDFKFCLDELFYYARLDDRYDQVCKSIGVFMYSFMFLVTGMLCVQVLCSLMYLAKKHRVFHADDLQAGVVIMVPCYNEGVSELRKTISSCVQTSYPDENKIMIVVADGMVTGANEEKSTPEITADILGFRIDLERDEVHHYVSLGKKRDNFACMYTGTYTDPEPDTTGENQPPKSLKYIVIVKRGQPSEKDSGRAGNRGKRDSQLIIAGMLNRIHHNREPVELDMALVKALFTLGLPAKDVEYLMTIDADTRVDVPSINHMVYHMDHDKSVLACCGETQVDNKTQSWVTRIQVFEYYSSHHMKKAFESVFGCVTCLPGCFTMYRIFTEDMKCLIANDQVYKDYSRNDIPSLHEKNLFELGEDRMLTTLLLQHFPGMSLSFVPEAICWTIVPHTINILLSQRRRWINSTFHNMYELLKVKTLCGIGFMSMKLVVIMDLIVTMTLPASFLYVGYLAYLFITQPEAIDKFVLIVLGVTFGMQMVSFLIRSRWDYMWWFVIFTFVGVPIFYFILPVYAFTHMDDFSWGKTREVGGEQKEEEEEMEEALKGKSDSSSKSVKSNKSKKKRKGGTVETVNRLSDSSHDERSQPRDNRSHYSYPSQTGLSFGTSTLPSRSTAFPMGWDHASYDMRSYSTTATPASSHDTSRTFQQSMKSYGDTSYGISLGASTLPSQSYAETRYPGYSGASNPPQGGFLPKSNRGVGRHVLDGETSYASRASMPSTRPVADSNASFSDTIPTRDNTLDEEASYPSRFDGGSVPSTKPVVDRNASFSDTIPTRGDETFGGGVTIPSLSGTFASSVLPSPVHSRTSSFSHSVDQTTGASSTQTFWDTMYGNFDVSVASQSLATADRPTTPITVLGLRRTDNATVNRPASALPITSVGNVTSPLPKTTTPANRPVGKILSETIVAGRKRGRKKKKKPVDAVSLASSRSGTVGSGTIESSRDDESSAPSGTIEEKETAVSDQAVGKILSEKKVPGRKRKTKKRRDDAVSLTSSRSGTIENIRGDDSSAPSGASVTCSDTVSEVKEATVSSVDTNSGQRALLPPGPDERSLASGRSSRSGRSLKNTKPAEYETYRAFL